MYCTADFFQNNLHLFICLFVTFNHGYRHRRVLFLLCCSKASKLVLLVYEKSPLVRHIFIIQFKHETTHTGTVKNVLVQKHNFPVRKMKLTSYDSIKNTTRWNLLVANSIPVIRRLTVQTCLLH